MKPITIHVSEPLYQEFQKHAKQTDRKAAELIREAMQLYRDQKIRKPQTHSIRDIKPISVGKILKPWTSRSEMLEDFFDDRT
jgi:ribbon-helix-helix CopG family protein